MENAESPTKNQLNSTGRNVLKELNNLDGANKSPKHLLLKDELPTPNESSNLLKNLPDIITTIGDTGEDEDFMHSTPLRVAPNRNHLNPATPDEHQSEDELFFDCNTTLRSTIKASVVIDTLENVSAILNEASQILVEEGPSQNGMQIQIYANETLIVSSGENLNDGFINVTESSTGKLETTNHSPFSATDLNIGTDNQDQAVDEIQSEDVKRLILSNQSVSEDTSVSLSLIGDFKSAIPTHIDAEADTQILDDHRQENTSLSATEDSNRFNETVDIVPNVDSQQNVNFEPIDFTTKKINSEVALSSVGLDHITDDQTRMHNQFTDVQQSAVFNQASPGNSTFSDSNSKNATTDDTREANTESVGELLPTVQDSKVESVNLNETVNILPAGNHQLVLDSTPTNEYSIPPEKSSAIAASSEKLVNTTNDFEKEVSVVTLINDPIDVEASQNGLKAAVELSNLSETNTPKEEIKGGICYQESTFILTESPSDGTIVLAGNLDQETEVVASNENDSRSTELPTLKQIEEIREFETNQATSVDSLDTLSENRNCSLDSIEMKQSVQHEPILQSDEMATSVKTDKIMADIISPAVSEHSFNKSNEPVISGCLLPQESPIRLMSVESEVPLLSENIQNENQSDFAFKSPLLPNSTLTKMSNHQGGDSDFMVLNSNDFDFLQSRGGNSVDPEDDRRSSLLLRFDPLQRLSIIPFTPAVQRVEESAEGEQSRNHIEPLLDLCSNTSDESSSGKQKISTAKPPATNETAMSIGLVHNSNSMDNEAKAYVNNIKPDRTEDKHMQIDGVPLTDKKIKIKYTDEDIQKRMEEYEATQEILLKRLSEKDKAIVKTSNVLELYEKAIAEVLAAKEKLAQTYEKTHEELKTDRDLNFQHLLSLESTFSDLHMKFERNIQYTTQLQEKLNALEEEKTKSEDLLAQQETRYDKLTGHALQQFDIANAKWEEQTKSFSSENTKLKALIKREEIYKNAVQEELLQKKRENEELVKICDELISGQKS